MSQTVGDFIVQRLHQWGVRHMQLIERARSLRHHPPAPPELRSALTTIDRVIADYVTAARLGKTAA